MGLDPTLPITLSSQGASDAHPLAVTRSMYMFIADNGDGENHLLYNTLTGNFLKVPSASIRFLLDNPDHHIPVTELNPFQCFLFEQGFLVPHGVNERNRSRLLYNSRYWSKQQLELILLPHENCNFRCPYCYESFARNKMEPWVRDAVKRFVLTQAEDFKSLAVSWFGGEPTLALDVMYELSTTFIDFANQNGIAYSSGITTNGYRLTGTVARKLILDCKIAHFQITLDGPQEQHDKRRYLAGGGATFHRIYDNLLNMRTIETPFTVVIRVNFDSENMQYMDDFTKRLAEDFASDGRFIVHFFPISNWGGEVTLPLCNVNAARLMRNQFLDAAANLGLSSHLREEIKPLGSMCYAADPNSFIIGSNGAIYKCTVAFDEPRNQVGMIRPDGTMSIDLDKFSLWVTNEGVTDPGCQSCFFNPSCQGMACPLYRLQTNQRPCPPLKQSFPETLRQLVKEMKMEMSKATANNFQGGNTP